MVLAGHMTRGSRDRSWRRMGGIFMALSAYDMTYAKISTHISTGTDHLLVMRDGGGSFFVYVFHQLQTHVRIHLSLQIMQNHLFLHCVKTRLMLSQPIRMQDYSAKSTVEIKSGKIPYSCLLFTHTHIHNQTMYIFLSSSSIDIYCCPI